MALNRTLASVCALQRQYGKSPAELGTLVEGFSWALAEFPVAEVIKAIGVYISYHPDIPTPSDIRKIIEPPKPEFSADWSFYNFLKKALAERGQYALDDDELKYIQKCERHSITLMKDSES